MTTDALERGRECFGRHAWGEAYALLSDLAGKRTLEPEDLERLATAAHQLGRDAEGLEHWVEAHRGYQHRGDQPRAARCAFWVAVSLLFARETARAAGWLARAHRLLDEGRHDCVERGYLLAGAAFQSILGGETVAAYATFGHAAAVGERFRDRDLVTFARQGQGRALIRLGEVGRGVALLDEVMVAVTAGEVSPTLVGDIYCSVIEACHEVYDLRRAQEWTAALTRWCEAQPDHIPYRGHCLVRRAEIHQLRGAWADALEEARRAQEYLTHPPHRGAGAACYRIAELHRLRGEFAMAEAAYREAARRGREPQPGLALLRMAQGRLPAARAAIGRAREEAGERRARAGLLAAYVEIVLAAGDLPAARAAAAELSAIAAELGAPFLQAQAAYAAGAILLAEDDPLAALGSLRRACTGWRELGAPYEAARARVLLALACRALGDHDAGAMELEAAREVFQRLDAAPDLARLKQLARPARGPAGGLTGREVEVLRLIATGKTNRAIAGELAISERTVARHVSNIFTKLGVSSRSAATAYAYRHDVAAAPG